jgi:hypothetical protein
MRCLVSAQTVYMRHFFQMFQNKLRMLLDDEKNVSHDGNSLVDRLTRHLYVCKVIVGVNFES